MVLKRKRSSSELCSSPSASSTCSSAFSFCSPPTTTTTTTQAPIFWDGGSNVSRNLFNGPTHLNSRTMKRFRDGRPSEELVHQRTLNLLFAAQQQQQQHETPTMTQPQPEDTLCNTTQSAQHSLHRFWNIASAPKPPTTNSAVVQQPQQLNTGCEDCGASLVDTMMDVDGSGSDATACGACGKHVCFSCSVSNLGEEKRCLQCAGRRHLTGSVGWTTGPMQMA
ncbi:hypothetical protein NLU13_1310 [Sarocladium strictum]|uniref:Uncharacterized protein n=1 Tax=Sarocladium strictum TaxID=5046 RepID=A0AA39GRI7_SARSR|nr:hypothetical protein NLU13_1310 [Sarocladium strictum]